MDPKTGRPAQAHIHRSTEIYRGRVFSFVTEDLTLPNGRRTEMAMVRHSGSTGIVPLLDGDTVLMEHQYRAVSGTICWKSPLGPWRRASRPSAAPSAN